MSHEINLGEKCLLSINYQFSYKVAFNTDKNYDKVKESLNRAGNHDKVD